MRKRRGPPLRLIWDGNAIGAIGATAFLRTLSESGCTSCRVSLKGCSIDGHDHQQEERKPKPGDTSAAALAYKPKDAKDVFEWREPAGDYMLDLQEPYDHTIACELCELAESTPGCFIEKLELFTVEESREIERKERLATAQAAADKKSGGGCSEAGSKGKEEWGEEEQEQEQERDWAGEKGAR